MITALKKKFAGPNPETSGAHPLPNMGQLGTPSHPNRAMFPSSPNNSSSKIGGRKSPNRVNTPAGVNVVSAELQKKFAHGVNFNMKVIIKGDRNSGKTSLWRRLQGLPFQEAYNPTQEIQVANITWNYRTYDHIVKLDIWDIVDEGVKKRQPNPFLKLDNNPSPDGSSPAFEMVRNSSFENAACDASIVDVYKNCNGVLLLFDVTKAWTWGYVQRELDRISSQIPVLIMANKIDLHAERQVREDECLALLRVFRRKPAANGRMIAPVRYTQCSMKTAEGLKFLYNFFNVPFLFLQREYLETALEANNRDLEIAQQELDLCDENGGTKNFDSRASQKPAQEGDGVGDEEEEDSNIPAEIMKSERELPFNVPLKLPSSDIQPSEFSSSSNASKPMSTAPKISCTQGKTLAKKKEINVPASVVRKTSAGSTSSSENNQMVDMYEEDFDSNDEMQRTLREFQSLKTDDSPLPPTKESASSPLEALSNLDLGANFKANSFESTNSQLDAWFSSANTPTQEAKQPFCSSSVIKQENPEDVELSPKKNPLVSHYSDDELEKSSCTSDEAIEVSDETPSNSYTVESSTSCSTTGFTHVVSPATKNKKDSNRQLVSSSSTLTSISATKSSTNEVEKIPKNKKSVKGETECSSPRSSEAKKKKRPEGKKVKKSASKMTKSSNLLCEDLDFPKHNTAEQYDPL